ncbi:MAG TPA: sterol desaturase family protein [Bacteroidia bacterium]|jgi:sterol desaturase/sphingolipid hydroxylase (fatty acid hydroxylase superfamily)|nr:sterol desaturase family protein [Bacteroidia bacterium]
MLNTIILVIPILLSVTLLEWYISHKRGDHVYSTGNYVMNLAIGAMDQVASLIYFGALFFSLKFVYDHFAYTHLGNSWYIWAAAYIVIDLLSYWYHRFSHRVNILWAGHVTHHSSEHFNFSNGFRTSFFQGINRILFWCILPLFGFSPLMLVIILKVSGLYDFLLHTSYVPKLGFLEKIFITPSQHRVHHGRNDIYIDKNYGSTFVIWDKMFGTYQEETEPVEFGIKGNYVDNDPLMAIGYYYQHLWRVMKMQKDISRKINMLFIPPERTPSIVRGQKELSFHNDITPQWRSYAFFQVAFAIPGLIMMLLFKDFLPPTELIVYSAIGITSMSTGALILNGKFTENFQFFEVTRLFATLLFVITHFYLPGHHYMISILFFLLSSLFLFRSLKEKEEDKLTR